MLGGHFSAGLLDQRDVLAGAFDEDFVLAFPDGLGIDQFAANGYRAGTGAEEVGSGIEIDAAGGGLEQEEATFGFALRERFDAAVEP